VARSHEGGTQAQAASSHPNMNRSSATLLAVAVAAGVAVGGGATYVFARHDEPAAALTVRPAILGAAEALCPDGTSLTAAQRIGTGAANAFEQFDGALADDDRAVCGDPLDAASLGTLVAIVQGEMIDHDDANERMAFSLEVSSVLAARLGVALDVDAETAALIDEGRFDDAAERQRSQDDTGGQDFLKSVVNDAVGTVRDGDAHDEFRRIWAAVHEAVDND